MTSNTGTPGREQAQRWLDRWDRQQEHYVTDREEPFAVIGDVLEDLLQRPDPLIVDPGVGPEPAEAREVGFEHVVTDRPSVHDYLDFLREAGVAEAGIVWQVGDDRIAAGVR